MNAKPMSRQEIAKTAQGYTPKAIAPVCGNCAHFRSKLEKMRYSQWTEQTYTKESEMRCGIGGFKVGKSATCDRWEKRPASSIGESHGD